MKNDQRRYARHLALPEVGIEGQRKIRSGRVLCVGAGGLGSSAAVYLAAAGVGKLGVVDDDVVEVSNLPRQLLHFTADIGRSKTDSARETVQQMNPDVMVECHKVRLTRHNAPDIVEGYDLVIDGSDNLATRYLANDVCIRLRKPLLYGAVRGFEGQAAVMAPHLGGPCYRCMFPKSRLRTPEPTRAQTRVLGMVPGVIGCIQATEALKLLVGCGDLLIGRLLYFDALGMQFRVLKVGRDPACRACRSSPTVRGDCQRH